jgi:hypothetical protein
MADTTPTIIAIYDTHAEQWVARFELTGNSCQLGWQNLEKILTDSV